MEKGSSFEMGKEVLSWNFLPEMHASPTSFQNFQKEALCREMGWKNGLKMDQDGTKFNGSKYEN